MTQASADDGARTPALAVAVVGKVPPESDAAIRRFLEVFLARERPGTTWTARPMTGVLTDSERVARLLRRHGGAMTEAHLLAELEHRYGRLSAGDMVRLSRIVGRIEVVEVRGERVARVLA